MAVLRSCLFAALLALPCLGQTVIPRNHGGGCGGTLGYPTLIAGDQLGFVLRRSLCPGNSWTFPTGVILGFRPQFAALPFVPGFAPGCTVLQPVVYLPSGSAGGSGTTVLIAQLTQVPLPITVYVQGVVICSVNGYVPQELAVSDAWELTIR